MFELGPPVNLRVDDDSLTLSLLVTYHCLLPRRVPVALDVQGRWLRHPLLVLVALED